MTLAYYKGEPPQWHDNLSTTSLPSFATLLTLDASTEKAAVVGCIWHPTQKTGTINIRKVHFRTGAVTFNAASAFRVSLQNVSATAGPPMQPDAAVDESYSFAGSGLTANSWISTGNLSADRVVDLSATSITSTNSRWVSVVFEYTTFTAADSIIISALASGSSAAPQYAGLGGVGLLNTAAYVAQGLHAPVIAFECDDGSYAFMSKCYPVSATSTVSIANNAAIRAAGMKFRVDKETQIDGMGLAMAIPNGADGTLTLYDSDGTTVLRSIAIDNDAVLTTTSRLMYGKVEPVTLAANTYYRLAFVSTTTTAATMAYIDVNAAGLMDAFALGQDLHWTQRDAVGAWTETTTRRPIFMLDIVGVHDGSGGGGGNTYSRGRIVNQ